MGKGETALAIDANEPAAAGSCQIGLDCIDWYGRDRRDQLRLEAAADQRRNLQVPHDIGCEPHEALAHCAGDAGGDISRSESRG